ncbi:hypothetical protein ACFQBP_41700, partial [Paraburkholderia dipogonis]
TPSGRGLRCAASARVPVRGRGDADQAAPEYVRDKVAQTTAERVAEKAEKAAKAARAEQAARLAHDAAQGEGRQ